MGEEPGAPSTPASLLLLMFIPLFMPWRLIPRTPASFMLGHGLRGAGTVVYLRARMGEEPGAQAA